ncbi:MAG: hypothetical protein ACTSWY_12520, partial [Promethearchaeota archaeon]
KFIIPYLITPKKELRDEERYYGYLEELTKDGNLFSYGTEQSSSEEDEKDEEDKENFETEQEERESQRVVLANVFISFGEKHNNDYLYLIRNKITKAIEYLPGNTHFYSYPKGETAYAILLENNTNIKVFLEDILDKFDRMIRRKSYLHVLEDLHINRESFDDVLDIVIALIESYQECEEILYDEEEIKVADLFDEELEEKITELSQDTELIEGFSKEIIGNATEETDFILMAETDEDLNEDKTEEISIIDEKTIENEKLEAESNSNRSNIGINRLSTVKKGIKSKNAAEKKDEGVLGWIKKREQKTQRDMEQENREIETLEQKKKEMLELKKMMEEEEKQKIKEEEEKKKTELMSLAERFNKV